jgi:putative RNA 2'-phosphotransferase
MDEAGWVNLDDLLRIARMSKTDLDRVMNTDPKHRLQLVGERIRACQGHSLDTGVTREGLERSWSGYHGAGSIWHGTQLSAVPQIARQGLVPGARTHVHCADTPDSTVGKRSAAHVLLEVSPAKLRAAGQDIFESPNGVVLVRHIPRGAIIGVVPCTKEARKQESQMRIEFGLIDMEKTPPRDA